MRESDAIRHSSITLLSGFCLSFLYIMAFGSAYVMTADWVALKLPLETGGLWAVWGPPVFISLVTALLCCALIVPMKNKLVVPVGFVFLAIYYVIFVWVLHRDYAGAELAYLTQLIGIYMLPPVVTGNLLGWSAYLLLRRKNPRCNPAG